MELESFILFTNSHFTNGSSVWNLWIFLLLKFSFWTTMVWFSFFLLEISMDENIWKWSETLLLIMPLIKAVSKNTSVKILSIIAIVFAVVTLVALFISGMTPR